MQGIDDAHGLHGLHRLGKAPNRKRLSGGSEHTVADKAGQPVGFSRGLIGGASDRTGDHRSDPFGSPERQDGRQVLRFAR
jgi:hypothetical protein